MMMTQQKSNLVLRLAFVFALVFLCEGLGLEKLGAPKRRASNAKRDYGLLGNLFARIADRWSTKAGPENKDTELPTAEKSTKTKTGVGGRPLAPQEGPAKKKRHSKKESAAGAPPSRLGKFAPPKGRGAASNTKRDYGPLGNLLARLADRWYQKTPAPAADDEKTTPPVTPGNADEEGPPVSEEAEAVEAPEEKDGKAAVAPFVAEEENEAEEGGEASFEEDEIDGSEETSSEALPNMKRLTSPSERLKNLLEPFVLGLRIDDGGLRAAVEKLQAWEANERVVNENFIGGGLAAL